MTAARKIPQNIAKELQRHVQSKSPKPRTGKAANNNDGSGDRRNKSLITLFGCVGFVGVTASLPLWFMKWIEPLNERDGVSQVVSQSFLFSFPTCDRINNYSSALILNSFLLTQRSWHRRRFVAERLITAAHGMLVKTLIGILEKAFEKQMKPILDYLLETIQTI